MQSPLQITTPITEAPTTFFISPPAPVPVVSTPFSIKPPLEQIITYRKTKGGKDIAGIGTYKPSLVGIELFKSKGITMPKAPKVTAGIGLRLVPKTAKIKKKKSIWSVI